MNLLHYILDSLPMLTTPNKLTKILSGVAVLGIATAIAAPAQAFTVESTLEWDNGTSDFRNQVSFTTPGNTFSVDFSPASLGGQAAIFIATGDFAPIVGSTPVLVPVTQPATGNFQLIGETGIGTGIFEYTLLNNLVFDFNGAAEGIVATLPAGASFLGEIGPGNSVEFELEEPTEWVFQIPGHTETAFSSVFEFGDLPTAGGGTYDAEGVVGVPEPASLLGLLAVGGLGLVSKLKKQK